MSERTVDREKLKEKMNTLFECHAQATNRLCEALRKGHAALEKLEARETEKAIEEFEAAADLFVGAAESLENLREIEKVL